MKKSLAFFAIAIIVVAHSAFGQAVMTTPAIRSSPAITDTSPITRYAIAAQEGQVDTGAWASRLKNPMLRAQDSADIAAGFEAMLDIQERLRYARNVQDTALTQEYSRKIEILRAALPPQIARFRANYGVLLAMPKE